MQFVLNQHKFPKVILKYRIIRTRLLLILLHLDDEIVERIEDSLSLFCVSNTRGSDQGQKLRSFLFMEGRATHAFLYFSPGVLREWSNDRSFFSFYYLVDGTPNDGNTSYIRIVLFTKQIVILLGT